MTIPNLDPATIMAKSLDADPSLSADEIFQKFRARQALFWTSVIFVPLVAVGFSALVPSTYKSNAQLLIRHQGGAATLYSDSIPSLPPLSGASSAELMRSDPIVSEMIKSVDVETADIARPAYKVILGKIIGIFIPSLSHEKTGSSLSESDQAAQLSKMAADLKLSIDATTLMVDRGGSALKDEVIDVTIKSTNRQKVAAMVNALSDAFIASYQRRYEERILAVTQTFEEEAIGVETELRKLRGTEDGESETPLQQPETLDNRPLASNLARTVSDLQLRVIQLSDNYSGSSPELKRAKAELDKARHVLAVQQAVDAASDSLSAIRKKQRQLILAKKVFDSNQSDITIVERATPPSASKLVPFIKYGAPAAAGLIAGAFIGLIGVALTSLLDPRLFVSADITPASGLPLLGIVPNDHDYGTQFKEIKQLPTAKARAALLQALGKLEVLTDKSPILIVGSAENEACSGSVALQLSVLLAKDRDSRVLLIDANFDQPSLTTASPAKGHAGLLETLTGSCAPEATLKTSIAERLNFIGVGKLALRDEAGFSRARWAKLLEYLGKENTTVVIHIGGLLNSREAASIAKSGSRIILVTERKLSKKQPLATASALLAEIGAQPLGVIHGTP